MAAELRERFRGYKPGSTFTPPRRLKATVTIPGLLGGANWSGASFDPASGLLFVNVNNLPHVLTIKQAAGRCRVSAWHHGLQLTSATAEGYSRRHARNGVGMELIGVLISERRGESWRAEDARRMSGRSASNKDSPTSATGEYWRVTIVTAGGLVYIGADEGLEVPRVRIWRRGEEVVASLNLWKRSATPRPVTYRR